MSEEPTFGQSRSVEAIDRAAAEMTAVVRHALAANHARADEAAAMIGKAASMAKAAVMATD